MNITNKDNTLKIMTVLLSVMFLLIALKAAYADSVDVSHNEDYISFWLNVIWIFALYEVPFILSVYVAGPMISDAIPMFFTLGRMCMVAVKHSVKNKIKHEIHRKRHAIPQNPTEQKDKSIGSAKEQTIIELSEEIKAYVTGTFRNLLSDEQIGKLINNFSKLNTCGPFEVVEKRQLQGVFEFDLIHFAWNVCRRIHNPDTCPKIFGFASAEMIKASFPLTLKNYAVSTIKSRLKDSDIPTKFRLQIIEVDQPLVPHVFPAAEETG